MPAPKKLYIDGRFGQLHLRKAAPDVPTQNPLLCLHMFPQSGRNFERFLAEASTRRTVIAPDFPGYGESDPPPHPITAQEYAQSIWEVVDTLELTKSHRQIDVFGIHAGAKLTVELAHQRPDEINRIILSSAAVLKPDELQALRESFTSIPLDDEGTRFQRLWRMVSDNRGPDMSYQEMATCFAEMLRGGERYEWGHHAVFDYNQFFVDKIRSLPHRITLINPKDDLYEFTPRTLAHLQNGDLLDRPDWGHGFLESRAGELAQTVDQLLN